MAGKSKIVTGALEGLADVTEKFIDYPIFGSATRKDVTAASNSYADDVGLNEVERKNLIEEEIKDYAKFEAEGEWAEIQKRAEASGNGRFIQQAITNADDSPDPTELKLGGETLYDIKEVPNDFDKRGDENSSWYRMAIGTLDGLIDEFGDYEAFKRMLD